MPSFRTRVDRKHDKDKDKFKSSDIPPPQLKLVNDNYINEDAFLNVSLNLLARYQALNLTSAEAIEATLITPEERISFYKALCFRMAQESQVGSYSTSSTIQSIHQEFGEDLQRMCKQHLSSLEPPCLEGFQAPMAPRNIHGSVGFHRFLNPRKLMQTKRRSFFPESDSRNSRQTMNAKVRNIDWQLASAVQEVSSLRLDDPSSEKRDFSCYEPPSPMHCRAT